MSDARPIIMSAPMVCALLAGKKSQTRRIVKPQPLNVVPFVGTDNKPTWEYGICNHHHGVIDRHVRCPHGQPGDLLYVKEAWRVSSAHDALPPRDIPHDVSVEYVADGIGYFDGRYRHARFMPRRLSRLTLSITDVSAERLQDIGVTDAIDEGIEFGLNDEEHDALERYAELWGSLHGLGSWAQNPWTWRIEFTTICANVDRVMEQAA